ERENEEKTSAVHFVRFELSDDMAAALGQGAALSVGVDHENYRAELSPVPDAVRAALVADLAREAARGAETDRPKRNVPCPACAPKSIPTACSNTRWCTPIARSITCRAGSRASCATSPPC